jgi:hypothetical protein
MIFNDSAILRALSSLAQKVNIIMSTVAELEVALNTANDTLGAVAVNVENIAADVANLDAEIADLKTQLANVAIPASAQAALDALTATSASLATRTAVVAAITPDTANPV